MDIVYIERPVSLLTIPSVNFLVSVLVPRDIISLNVRPDVIVRPVTQRKHKVHPPLTKAAIDSCTSISSENRVAIAPLVTNPNHIPVSLNVELLSNVASYLLFVNQGPGTVKKVYRKVSEVPNGNFKLKSAVLTKDIAAEMVQNGFPREDIMEEFTSLEDCAAEEFGKIKDQACELKLIGLKKLSEKNAEALSRFQGNYLSLSTLEISDKAIETLLQGLKCEFRLGNEKITDSLANILKSFKGPVLYLGIIEISASCAKALAEFRGSLHLNQLKNIPSEALAEFANYSGPDLLLNGFEEKIPKCR